MTFKELNKKSIREAFEEFDSLNPGIYSEFKNQVFKAISAGADKISSKAIINWIRWEFFLKTTDHDFKVNDAFTPLFARKFIKDYPEHSDKFELRKLRTEEKGPYIHTDVYGQTSFI